MIDYKVQIAQIIAKQEIGLTAEEIAEMIEVPTDPKNGDFAFPCFRLAKTMRKAPQMIAADVASSIENESIFDKVEQVNAYVNMFICKDAFVRNVVSEVVSLGCEYGKSNVGEGKTVIVEFSSPNIAKPFHIGHIRSTVIGNSIYKLYDATGYDVVRINHLGDYGTQLIVAYRLWGSEEELEKNPIKSLLKYYTKFHEEAEKDPSLDDKARETFAKLENGEPEEVELWKRFRELSLEEFSRVYKMLDIEFDSYAGESFYSDKMPAVLKELKDKNLMHESRGAQIVDLEDYDMPPAVITKSDGSSLYATRDIAAAIYRKQHYDFYKNIYVVATQQNLHFKQWKQVLALMGYSWEKDCIHVPFGLVSLEEGTMSTRKGRVVFLEDVLNKAVEKTREIISEKNTSGIDIDEISKEVGIGAVIFQELSNNRIKDYVFSWDKILNFDGETGPYVQYTHARASSVLRNASQQELDRIKNCDIKDFSYVTSDSAYELTKLIYRVPEVVREAAAKYEPSILTRHLIDIAQSFNRFYHDEHILVDNEEEKVEKLALVYAAKVTIANCLALLGIKAPDKM